MEDGYRELVDLLSLRRAKIAANFSYEQAIGAGLGALVGLLGNTLLGLQGGLAACVIVVPALMGLILCTAHQGYPLWQRLHYRLRYRRRRLHQTRRVGQAATVHVRTLPARDLLVYDHQGRLLVGVWQDEQTQS